MPRPRRLRLWVEPSLSLISLSFIANTPGLLLVDDANEMLDSTDHAANGRGIFQRTPLVVRTANRAADLFDSDRLRFSLLGSLSHLSDSSYSSEALPEAARRA